MNKFKHSLIKIISPFRARVTRILKPASRSFPFPNATTRSMKPLSDKHGFDRGTPVDRYYIEKFLEENKEFIKGRCLEIHDDAYTKRFGGSKVTKSDVLDINESNKLANVYGDLRDLNNIGDNIYDTVILTHTIGMIDDVWAVIKECHRIMKTGGNLLVTSSAGIKSHRDPERSFWRLGVGSAKYLFGKYFEQKNIHVYTYGNLIACQAFLVGLAKEELSKEELEYNDKQFPLIITIRAEK